VGNLAPMGALTTKPPPL